MNQAHRRSTSARSTPDVDLERGRVDRFLSDRKVRVEKPSAGAETPLRVRRSERAVVTEAKEHVAPWPSDDAWVFPDG